MNPAQTSWNRIEHWHEIHTEQLDSRFQASSLDGSSSLQQRSSGAATEIEPAGFTLSLQNLDQEIQGIESEICLVAIRAREVSFAIHTGIGNDLRSLKRTYPE